MAKRGHVQAEEPKKWTPGRGYAQVGTGPLCPINPEHGNLLEWKGEYAYMCPHVDHDGRNGNHPLGPAPRTQSFFRLNDV